MTRKLFALALLVGVAPTARSQDMPLSQILIDGEGWVKVGRDPEERPRPPRPAMPTGFDLPPGIGPILVSRDRQTVYVVKGKANAITAYPHRLDTKPADFQRLGAPYCPLRTKPGEAGIAVTGLTTDHAGRIYAATEIGVQVFDPTGRLCGVLTPAAPGTPSHLSFEGNELVMWIGDAKYSRKLNATGVK